MTKSQSIKFFGTAANLARALGVTRGAVSHWPERLPPFRQFQLHHASGGVLPLDPECLPPATTKPEAA